MIFIFLNIEQAYLPMGVRFIYLIKFLYFFACILFQSQKETLPKCSQQEFSYSGELLKSTSILITRVVLFEYFVPRQSSKVAASLVLFVLVERVDRVDHSLI